MSEGKKTSLWEKLAPILVIISIVLAFVVGILWQKVSSLEKGGTKTKEGTTETTTTGDQQPKITLDMIKGLFDKDLVKFGDANRKVLFVEISDPSCPYCHIAGGKNPELSRQIKDQNGKYPFTYVQNGGNYLPPVPEMKKLLDQGKASYIYLYTPGHGSGEMGTKALYCAFELGKFWEVHDLIMTNKSYELLNNTIKNDKTKSQELADFLKSAIDPSKLKTCLDSGKYDNRLTSDTALAESLGITGTPGFIINDQIFAGAYSYKDMESVVNAALK